MPNVEMERLLEDSISERGVRRIHLVRQGALPDIDHWRAKAPAGVEVFCWGYDEGLEKHIHLAWKEGVKVCTDPVEA